MDHSRASSLVSPVSNTSKPSESPSRLRKRLQKKLPSFRRSAPIKTPASNKVNAAVGVVAQQAGTVGQPSLRLSPDLSDAKWHEYLGTNGAKEDSPDQSRVPSDAPAPAPTPAPDMIPEFSHLAISNSKARPSLESSLSSPTSSISTRSSMRRYAKTPVYTIGQLEGAPCGRNTAAADKVSSVDLIARQYQALIESHDTRSICTDTRSDPLPSRQPSYCRSSLARSQYSSGELPEELRPDVYLSSPRRRPNTNVSPQSPTSDDGTLVAFDEEAIYFKPMSFSPEPPTPPPRSRARVQRSAELPPSNHNLSLQISTDLLARELSTTMLERPQQKGEDVSTLQIWVMIEAYERLRDQVLEMGPQNEGTRNLELMFDTWLGALYALHDKLTSDANSRESHYDETGLEAEGLD